MAEVEDPVRAARMRQRMERLYPVCAASPAPAYGRPSPSSPRPCRSRRWRCPRGRRCTTGRSTTSGRSGRPTSPTRPGGALVDVRDHTLHLVSATAPGPGARSRSTSSGRTCTRCPTIPTGSRTAPRYYVRNWGFCLSAAPARRPGRGAVRGGRRHDAGARRAELRRALPAGRHRRGGRSSPRTCATPRWSTTTCRASRSPSSWPRRSRRCRRAATATGSSSRRAPSARMTWLSRNPRGAPAHPARAGAHRPGRRRAAGLQADPACATGPSTPRRATSCAGAGARCVATRRTATTSDSSTRSGFDLPVGRLIAHPARGVPRVPHVRGRPDLRHRRRARGVAGRAHRDRRRPRARRDVRQPQSVRRAAAGCAGAVSADGREERLRRSDGDAVDAGRTPTGGPACWRSPRSRGSTSHASTRQPPTWPRRGSWSRRTASRSAASGRAGHRAAWSVPAGGGMPARSRPPPEPRRR